MKKKPPSSEATPVSTSRGRWGEEIACNYLENKGYQIVEINCRLAGVEIDVIAERERTLCFIEVKTRKTVLFGMPAAYVDFRKRRRIIRAAKLFSAKKKYREHAIRFDVIAILYNGNATEITHLEHAFEEE